MKTEDIVEAINIELKARRKELNIERKGHFILQRNIDVDSSFKAYKTYSVKLWYFETKKKTKVIMEDKITEKVLNNNDDNVVRSLNISFISKFLNFHNSPEWLNIIEHGISNIE